MGDDILKAVLTSAGALLVGWALYALQMGGRRRQQRQEIVEELEMLKLLDGRQSADALGRRIDRRLEEYLEPTVEMPLQTKLTYWGLRILAWALFVSFMLNADLTLPQMAIAGAVFAVALSLAEAVWEWRWFRSAEAKLVAALNGDDVITPPPAQE